MPNTARGNPIREGSNEKKELIALFKSKKWDRLPRGKDCELDVMMERYGWNKKQVAKHFSVWFRIGEDSNKTLARSKDDILQSLKEKCDNVQDLLTRTWLSRDISRLVDNEINLPPNAKNKMNDVSMWSTFTNDVFIAVSDHHASSGNSIASSSRSYCREIESLKQELCKMIEDDVTVLIPKHIFYLFATEFAFQIQQSFAESDIDEIEKEVVKKIMQSNVSLEKAHAETLYFIVGFVATAVKKEGVRRKKKGFLFSQYAELHCLGKEAVKAATALGQLPLQKTARVDQGGLRYPTAHCYELFVKIERIYCALLTDDNLFAFGPNALKRIHDKIASNKKIRDGLAIVFGKNAEGSDVVVDYALRTYARIRSSDAARKLLARSGKSRASATRTTLQVKSEESKKKRAAGLLDAGKEHVDLHGCKKQKTYSEAIAAGVNMDEFGTDEDFLHQCAMRFDEMVESRMADEDQLVRDEVDSTDEEESDIESESMDDEMNCKQELEYDEYVSD
jgi:hypothetical protein